MDLREILTVKIITCLSGVSLCMTLTACSTTSGPTPALGLDGPSRTETTASGLAKVFLDSEVASLANKPDPDLAKQMLTDGLTLVYSNCSDYFSSAGETQQWLIVTRDTVGAVGTLGTSVMALHNASRNAVANLALATGLTFSGLDIYTKNFLFSAENIDSVRSLVTNALVAHRETALSLEPFTYQSATLQILDNQNICTPAAISALARQAIKKGNVAAVVTHSGEELGLRSMADQVVLQQIGAILNPPGPITSDQAGALWWLLRDFSTDTQKSKIIGPKLVDLPAASMPFDSNGVYQSDWKYADSVGQTLDKLSRETKESFRSTITAAKVAAAKPAAPVGAPAAPGAVAAPAAQLPTPSFVVPSPTSSIPTSHVSVEIQ